MFGSWLQWQIPCVNWITPNILTARQKIALLESDEPSPKQSFHHLLDGSQITVSIKLFVSSGGVSCHFIRRLVLRAPLRCVPPIQRAPHPMKSYQRNPPLFFPLWDRSDDASPRLYAVNFHCFSRRAGVVKWQARTILMPSGKISVFQLDSYNMYLAWSSACLQHAYQTRVQSHSFVLSFSACVPWQLAMHQNSNIWLVCALTSKHVFQKLNSSLYSGQS